MASPGRFTCEGEACGGGAGFREEDAEDTAPGNRVGPKKGKGSAMTSVSDLHKKWMEQPDYAKAYDELETEFALAREMIEARTRAGLTQDELASRMETSRTVIARLESGRSLPS